MTPEWFFETFTELDLDSLAGKAALTRAEANPEDFEAVWRQVSKFNLYEAQRFQTAERGAPVLREGSLLRCTPFE